MSRHQCSRGPYEVLSTLAVTYFLIIDMVPNRTLKRKGICLLDELQIFLHEETEQTESTFRELREGETEEEGLGLHCV